MKIKKRYIFLILFIIMSLSSIMLLNDNWWNNEQIKIYNISVITSSKSNDNLLIIKEGMEQAASEMDVNISFITLAEDGNVEEQKKILERECKNGTDSILISPADYEKISKEIEEIRKKIPIILFDSKIKTNEDIPYIGCENEELGKSLADEVIQMGNTRGNIAIVKSNSEISSIRERYTGFVDIILKSNNKVEFIEISLDEKKAYNEVFNILKENRFDAIVTFDFKILEILGQCKKDITSEKEVKTEIYGTGGTNKITSFLEDDIIKAVAIQNDFNIGYLSIKMGVDIINNKSIEDIFIYSAVIDKRSMYTEENQRLLFPLVK